MSKRLTSTLGLPCLLVSCLIDQLRYLTFTAQSSLCTAPSLLGHNFSNGFILYVLAHIMSLPFAPLGLGVVTVSLLLVTDCLPNQTVVRLLWTTFPTRPQPLVFSVYFCFDQFFCYLSLQRTTPTNPDPLDIWSNSSCQMPQVIYDHPSLPSAKILNTSFLLLSNFPSIDSHLAS